MLGLHVYACVCFDEHLASNLPVHRFLTMSGPLADIPILHDAGGQKRRRIFGQLAQPPQMAIDLDPEILTMDIVALHHSRDDAWVVISGTAYDVTPLVREGCAALAIAAGTDISELFEDGYKHCSFNYTLLSRIKASALMVGHLGGPILRSAEQICVRARSCLAVDTVASVEVIEVEESQVAGISQAETQAYDFTGGSMACPGQSSDVVDLTGTTQVV